MRATRRRRSRNDSQNHFLNGLSAYRRSHRRHINGKFQSTFLNLCKATFQRLRRSHYLHWEDRARMPFLDDCASLNTSNFNPAKATATRASPNRYLSARYQSVDLKLFPKTLSFSCRPISTEMRRTLTEVQSNNKCAVCSQRLHTPGNCATRVLRDGEYLQCPCPPNLENGGE